MKISEIANNFQKIERQKEQTKALLTEISENFEFALVAGGAPRNWAYNRPANDIDIYVLRKIPLIKGRYSVKKDSSAQEEIDKNIAKAVLQLSEKYGFSQNRACTTINSNAYGGLILNSLYDFKIGDQDCQFIIVDDNMWWQDIQVKDLESFANRIFATYDFGICKTAMDKDGSIIKHPDFISDFENNTFTCNIKELRRNNTSGMKKLVERFEKMEKYFPNHKMRISC